MKIELRDIDALLDSFQRSAAMDLRLSSPHFELRASKRKIDGPFESRAAPTPAPQAPSLASAPRQAPSNAATPSAPPAAREPVRSEAPEGHTFVKAANLGTFYRAPKPGAPSYVEVGSSVSADTEVCLIEVMKLFTPLSAGVSGVVRDILVSDGALVEFEQPLFLVELKS